MSVVEFRMPLKVWIDKTISEPGPYHDLALDFREIMRIWHDIQIDVDPEVAAEMDNALHDLADTVRKLW